MKIEEVIDQVVFEALWAYWMGKHRVRLNGDDDDGAFALDCESADPALSFSM